MPTYEYQCAACEREMDIFQSMRDDALTSCPECGVAGQIVRKISGGAGIIFKGSGFYETDYKRQAEPKDGGSKDGGAKEGGSKEAGSKDSANQGSAAKPESSKSESSNKGEKSASPGEKPAAKPSNND